MFDIEDGENESITLGDGRTLKCKKRGKKRVIVVQRDGTRKKIVLENVKYVPGLAPYNLFSVTAAIRKGFEIGNKGDFIFLKKGNFELLFDHVVETKTGYVVGVNMLPDTTQTAMANPAIEAGREININQTISFHP